MEATSENAQQLLDALHEAGLGTASLTTVERLLANEITISNDWVRIDVRTSTPGLAFSAAWERRETVNFRGQSFIVVSRAGLIASKRAAERPEDLSDVRYLEAEAGDGAQAP